MFRLQATYILRFPVFWNVERRHRCPTFRDKVVVSKRQAHSDGKPRRRTGTSASVYVQFWSVFSLRDAGSTYQTVVVWWGQLVELSVLISSTQQFAFQSSKFILREGEYCFSAIYPVIKLPSFCLATKNISFRLEWNVLGPRVQTSLHGWPVWQLRPPLY